MIKSICSFSSQGQRPSHEDFYLASREKNVFIIADGFGGPTPGLAAARLGCESIRNFLVKEAGDKDATMPFVLRSYFSLAGNILFNAVLYANQKIFVQNKGKSAQEKGGASILAGYVDGDLLAIANVGSCSAWLIREDEVVELIIPRSYGRLIDPMGWNNPALDRTPLSAAGMSEDLEPEIFEYRVKAGDWVLFQTAIVDPASLVEIQTIKKLSLPPDHASREVSQLLSQKQFKNNTTFSLAIF